jgi:hypothetical protein
MLSGLRADVDAYHCPYCPSAPLDARAAPVYHRRATGRLTVEITGLTQAARRRTREQGLEMDLSGPARSLVAALAIAMVLGTIVPRPPAVVAAGTCGGLQGFNFGGSLQGGFQGFQAGFQGGFQGGFQAGGFNFGGGAFQGGFGGFNFGSGGLNFGGGLQNFGFNFGGLAGCGTGVFGLVPDSATTELGQPIVYRLVWVSPTTWHDIEFLDLRIRDHDRIVLLRWFEATNQFALVDPATGQVLASGQGLTPTILRAPGIEVLLQGTYKEDSGPTGQAVGLNIQLAITGPFAEGSTLSVDVAAKRDAAAVEPYELAALLRIAAAAGARNDPNNDDDEEEARNRRKTEEQRQQVARTNRSNLDDYRTEGNAVSSDCQAPIPTVTIANRDGDVVLQLLHDARGSCGLVQPGDYVEAIGEKQHELLYEAHQLTVRRNGTRVR